MNLSILWARCIPHNYITLLIFIQTMVIKLAVRMKQESFHSLDMVSAAETLGISD